jgi:large subunit ribosomal protein L27
MAKTKAAGSTKLGRDSIAKRLGVKLHDGQIASAGAVIVRQRGTKYVPGVNVRLGADDTLYASVPGTVRYTRVRKRRFDGKVRTAARVDIVPGN